MYNTILIFEQTSHEPAKRIKLIPNIGDLMRPFRYFGKKYKPKAAMEEAIPSDYAVQLTSFVIRHVWKAINRKWTQILELSNKHMNVLEDRVYAAPADELLTVVLWRNAAQWAKMKKLVNSHTSSALRLDHDLSEILRWMKRNDSTEQSLFLLEEMHKHFESLDKIVLEDLVVRTNHLSDLASLPYPVRRRDLHSTNFEFKHQDVQDSWNSRYAGIYSVGQ